MSILHLESPGKLVLAQSRWVETGPTTPRSSAVRRGLVIAASCLASFAAGWAIQVILVPLLLQQSEPQPVTPPQIATIAPATVPLTPVPEPQLAQSEPAQSTRAESVSSELAPAVTLAPATRFGSIALTPIEMDLVTSKESL